ncbi:UNVERIFIED_CONTAM: hypothetical protein Sangu_2316900 [Sesamum angustifolium]|uniref:SWIM-type domain-containing protein n=1 Tax=Sesamum angustifolium TaxID=2727405 RepID=A0AAW2L8T2_9LAMI
MSPSRISSDLCCDCCDNTVPSRSSTYAQFLKKIYQKIGVDSNEYLLKVSAKHSCQYLGRLKETLFPITNDDSLSFLLDPEAEIPMLEVYVDAEQIHVEPPPPMSQQWGEINPQMSQQWGEYMNLLATPGLPPCSNTDYLAGTSNPDFGAGTSNLDFGAEPTQSHTSLSEKFLYPTADSFVNESDEASEPDEAEYPIPPEDGPDRVDINVMAETFAERGAETSSEPALPDLNTQPTFYRSIPFFQQTFPEIPADSVDVPNLRISVGKLAQNINLRKFNRIMDEIKKQDVKAFAYLDAINKEKWTASHDGGWRCGILTTNMSECINGVLKGARRLPVSALVEITLERTVHYFHVRAMKGKKCYKTTNCGRISHARCSYLGNKKAVEHTVTKYSHAQQSASIVTRRQGRHGMNTHVVKIANRECSCGKWNQFGIPCSHAQKVCGAYNISAASMVKDYYDVMAYNNTYSKHFEPVQSEDYWDDPNFQLVHDPTIRTVTRPGRNQTTRIHNEMDWRQTRARQEAQQQQGDSSIQENVP